MSAIASPSPTYDRIAALPLTVERCTLERRERLVATSAFTRVTTVVRLAGAGLAGAGEDVTYDAADHDAPPAASTLASLRGRHTLSSFSRALETAPLWPRPPAHPVSTHYRRWAFESAALDLALRQAGLTLAQAAGRTPRPVRFVASFRLGDPPTYEPVRRRLDRYPSLRLKLDPTPAWAPALMERVASCGAVEVIDLKGIARGTRVDQPPNAAFYARTLAAFEREWVEDPGLTPETEAVLAPHWGRITWDAPVQSPGDVARLPARPPALNVKPSRIGTLERLLALYDLCGREGIAMYGGGQFELGPGRAQIQRLASLWHPDAPNDVAPAGYNDPLPAPRLPESPLTLPDVEPGFA